MKKSVGLSVCMVMLLIVAVSCRNKETKVYDGVVTDASMNNIILVTQAGDTVAISTMNADPAKIPGVLLNDSVRVTCLDKDVDGMKVLTAISLEILLHSPYYYIQGTWLEPNPIDSTQMQGFILKPDGAAESVNMATLNFINWNLDNRTLVLQYQSIGNKQTIEGGDTLNIVKINADSLVLSQNNKIVWNMVRDK